MIEAPAVTETIVCHCLQVPRAEVEAAIDISGCQTLTEVIEQTGAGSGCTCCHRHLCELLAARQCAQAVA